MVEGYEIGYKKSVSLSRIEIGRCKIWLQIDVGDALLVGFHPRCLNECFNFNFPLINYKAREYHRHHRQHDISVQHRRFTAVCAIHGCTWAGILPGRPHLDRRTIRVLNQSLWLKSLTARQRCLARNANALPFLRKKLPHVPTPNLEGQVTVFVRPLTIDQPGMTLTLSSIAQWIAEVRKPSHHGKVQSLCDGSSCSFMCYACQNTVYRDECCSPCLLQDGANREFHVLRMPKHRLPRRVLFSVPPSGWRKPRGGQHMTWQKGVKEITKSLGVVGVVRLPGWGPCDPICALH
ncbi:hypothetical protein T265_15120, partial [Opisthorchis viverrini]